MGIFSPVSVSEGGNSPGSGDIVGGLFLSNLSTGPSQCENKPDIESKLAELLDECSLVLAVDLGGLSLRLSTRDELCC